MDIKYYFIGINGRLKMSLSRLNVILNPQELEDFCNFFHVDQTDLELTYGWHKFVYLLKDRVFLFPRNPKYHETYENEILIYKFFKNIDNLPVPALIQTYDLKNIYYYKFAEVKRLDGIPFSSIYKDLTKNQLLTFFRNYAYTIAKIHNLPTENLPEKIKKNIPLADLYWKGDDLNHKTCIYRLLEPEQSESVTKFIHNLISEKIKKKRWHKYDFLLSKETKSIWKDVLSEIALLRRVLCHQDMQQNQILVDSTTLNISGIIDWEYACLENPVWDFSFRAWSSDFWELNHDKISDFKREMWEIYLNERQIHVSTFEGLDLFGSLWYFIHVLNGWRKDKIGLTRMNEDDCFKFCFNNLLRITDVIRNSPTEV